uniref:Kinesin-like protein n=3 Tax=Tetraselmis sp. GSL018 TaxID=582737 RepID=A0A061S1E0_9CHLO|mmetsp:Transcript_12895/g.30591  ORF Transcript_12895/g.30591 Transcript_12895/m.30591 type:complete len:572 (+) Transcript_12895:295-2010(+)|eukprot:CAMPEP_0177609926 /NCGR_PEP_ID=MMETSP0419_2-20121207/19429_1 /TAXON_ID=582737 /ORGANISM="Tetraselmis sp., Strain GSL018" /LENGTH=571 /DNA_ID=CAMNT_0019105043 /DNA_START=228 /DNA_END=1943 /DNA_ORIENTATION=-
MVDFDELRYSATTDEGTLPATPGDPGGPAANRRGRQDAIVVCTRFRPINAAEVSRGSEEAVRLHGDGMGVTAMQGNDRQEHTFTFDRCFGPETPQMEVYDHTCRPIVNDVLEGYYGTVFAYGQTGSGKTYTMEGVQGDEERKGIIPRAVEHLFDEVQRCSDNEEVTISASFVEIYLEKIRDLLDRSKHKANLEVRVDVNRGVYIDGAQEHIVSSDAHLLSVLESGSKIRHVSATGMNLESSRSHAIFMVTISKKNTKDLSIKTGKLFLVDLAGSEMVCKTGARGEQLEEAKNINKSLSALGNVIKALTDGKSSYIPYRDSKLTRILQDSLGGTSRACLICACSPASWNVQESISTLRFGTRAKYIKNKPKRHVGYGGTHADELLAARQEEIDKLRAQIQDMKASSTANQRIITRYQRKYGDLRPVPSGCTPDEVDGPSVNMNEFLDLANERSNKLQGQVSAIHKEASLARHALAEVERHLLDEKHVFSQVRTDVAHLLMKHATHDNEMQSEAKRLDDLLSMAKHRAKTMLGKLRPLARAAAAVGKAAQAVQDSARKQSNAMHHMQGKVSSN